MELLGTMKDLEVTQYLEYVFEKISCIWKYMEGKLLLGLRCQCSLHDSFPHLQRIHR